MHVHALLMGAWISLLLEQSRGVVLFGVFMIWALMVRRRNPETHKRLVIMATLMPLPAAIDRIEWLYSTMPGRRNLPPPAILQSLETHQPPGEFK